ncbi:acyl-CoA desaturase [Aeromicrobium sp. Leaf350]|uniref:fatty acid desaturase family protein n=1 Tax=Aeromicrobium sp. Leaf350 TaxID=2876565 RepID=UPI001E425756|nr:acyl-CoA desaturase [Aeromicrobium sp. Leaf350]
MSHKRTTIPVHYDATGHNQAPAPLSDATGRQATIGLDIMSREELDSFGTELDAVRLRTLESLGQADANYIRRIIRIQQWSEILGRIGIFTPFFWPTFVAGIMLLGLSKILENMEIGHNVMHGQYDWMNDPLIDGKRYEWDNVAPAQDWKHGHNYLHHTYTNIHGMDKDIGYGLLRIDEAQPWYPNHRFNLPAATLLMLFFEWGVMYHGLELGDYLKGDMSKEEFLARKKRALAKTRRQVFKDYVAFPVLALALVPMVGWWAPLAVLGATFTANIIRNIWTFLIIFCGHFPAEVQTFDEDEAKNESRGQWYLRQLLGSANISGTRPFHILSGNLSHQIEHHLFPDIPARRYPEVAREIRDICERHNLPYNTGRLSKQLLSVARQLGAYGAKPSDPYLVGNSPESKALRRAKREAARASAEGAEHLTA